MISALAGKIAIITGSDSGIGQASAILFAKHGADVAITWFEDRDGAEMTATEVRVAGRRALVQQLDQRDPTRVQKLFEAVSSGLGVPSILMNAGGIDTAGKHVADMSIEEWDDRLKTNLYGPFYCCQQFIRARRKVGGGGRIVNVTSVHEEIPRVGSAGYDCSKGGLRNLTRTLALELAPDRIGVNNLAPGMVLTPMNQAAIDDPNELEKQVQSIPMKRAAKPEEIARLALYLASDEADYVTGQSFTIDGGFIDEPRSGCVKPLRYRRTNRIRCPPNSRLFRRRRKSYPQSQSA